MLLNISKLIAHQALRLGGTPIVWHKATFCPGVRDNGEPCFDEESGTAWVECELCGGKGTRYADPVLIQGIYTDNSNEFIPDGSGGFMHGSKTLSVPANLDIRLLKDRKTGNGQKATRRILRDKFEILSSAGKVLEVLFLKQDPTKPWVSGGEIYSILTVENNI